MKRQPATGKRPSTVGPHGRLLGAACRLLVCAILLSAYPALADDEADLETAVKLFKERDYAGAVPLLEKLHAADPQDLDTALLLGIAYRRTGRDDDAAPLLRAASSSPDAQTSKSASAFLAPAEPPLSVYLLLRPEWDSNAALAAGALAPDQETTADGALLMLGSVEAGTHGFYVSDTLSYRRLARLTEYDSFENVAAAGLRKNGFALRYAFELARVGGAAFSLGHVADARWRMRTRVSPVLEARLAQRTYQTETTADLTGATVSGLVGVALRTRALDLQLGVTPLHEEARTELLTSSGVGGRVELRVRPVRRLSLEARAAVDGRRYGEDRRDLRVFADAALVVELTGQLSALAGATLFVNRSTDADFVADRTTVYAGLDLAL